MPSTSDLQSVLVTLALGVGLVFLLALLALALGALVGASKWARRQLAAVDAALVPFGKTPLGVMLNSYARNLSQRVDEPGDPLIQAMVTTLTGLTVRYMPSVAPKLAQVITPDAVSRFLNEIAANLVAFTDGRPADGAPSDPAEGVK